uniref:Uncharacterized protein n=1 Tax=Arundo donax TaxID=35708 RepID=A0A0A9AYX7_ARUDO
MSRNYISESMIITLYHSHAQKYVNIFWHSMYCHKKQMLHHVE